jgi:hypothetical protein
MTLTNAQLAAVITDSLHTDLAAIARALTPPVVPAALVLPGLVMEQSGVGGVPEWDPIIGGSIREGGQAYTSHRGTWTRTGHRGGPWMVDASVHFQFDGTPGQPGYGTIEGTLQVKPLPFRTAMRPGFFGGICLHSSNMHQNAAKYTGYYLWAGGDRTSMDVYGFWPGHNGEALTPAMINPNTQLIFVLRYPAADV